MLFFTITNSNLNCLLLSLSYYEINNINGYVINILIFNIQVDIYITVSFTALRMV